MSCTRFNDLDVARRVADGLKERQWVVTVVAEDQVTLQVPKKGNEYVPARPGTMPRKLVEPPAGPFPSLADEQEAAAFESWLKELPSHVRQFVEAQAEERPEFVLICDTDGRVRGFVSDFAKRLISIIEKECMRRRRVVLKDAEAGVAAYREHEERLRAARSGAKGEPNDVFMEVLNLLRIHARQIGEVAERLGALERKGL